MVALDASTTMLAQAVRETEGRNAIYVRGDALALPFKDESFDAVCCFAALYLFSDPMRAMAEMERVLAPGGRIAILTSCRRGPAPLHPVAGLSSLVSGVRVFGRDEFTGAFDALGLVTSASGLPASRSSSAPESPSSLTPPCQRSRACRWCPTRCAGSGCPGIDSVTTTGVARPIPPRSG